MVWKEKTGRVADLWRKDWKAGRLGEVSSSPLFHSSNPLLPSFQSYVGVGLVPTLSTKTPTLSTKTAYPYN
jgi:hypothetical protein